MFGNEEIPDTHSCDEMGCGSFSHVKYILTKPERAESNLAVASNK